VTGPRARRADASANEGVAATGLLRRRLLVEALAPHRRCPVDLAAALHSDGHRQCALPVPERDDARPTREPLWKPRWANLAGSRWANLPGVNLLAAVLPYPRRACSDWEDTDCRACLRPEALLRIQSAQVVLQTSLHLRAVVGATAAAAGGQHHCGERQRSRQEDQANTKRPFEPGLALPNGACHQQMILGGRWTNILAALGADATPAPR